MYSEKEIQIMKKITSLLIALVISLSMSMPAFAEELTSVEPSEEKAAAQEFYAEDAAQAAADEEQHQHVWGEWITDYDASCASTGHRYRMCTDPACGAYEEAEIPLTPHHWTNYYVASSPTIYAAGTQVQVCDQCWITRNVSIARAKPFVSWKYKAAKLQRKKSAKFKVNLAAGDRVVKWKSSKKKVATVSKSGVVKAKKNGKTKITAYTASGLKISCTVKVVKKIKKKTVKKVSGKVYWTPYGEVYHRTPNCRTLARSRIIYEGTVSQSGKSRPCKVCY